MKPYMVQLQRTRIEACHFAQHHTVEHHSQTVLRALISTRHTAIFEYRDLVACSGEPIRPGDGRSWSDPKAQPAAGQPPPRVPRAVRHAAHLAITSLVIVNAHAIPPLRNLASHHRRQRSLHRLRHALLCLLPVLLHFRHIPTLWCTGFRHSSSRTGDAAIR